MAVDSFHALSGIDNTVFSEEKELELLAKLPDLWARDQLILHNTRLVMKISGMMGKMRWTHIVQNYETLRRNGKLPATFEVIYGHAWKVPSKKAPDGRSIIQTPFKL